MPIIGIQTSNIGQTGQVPQFVYINTTDTMEEVTATGYLNHTVAQGNLISPYDMAMVVTKASFGAQPQVGLFDIIHSGGNWSLSQTTGDITGGESLGSGTPVYAGISGSDLTFNSIVAGSGMSSSFADDTITLTATGSGGTVTGASNEGSGVGLYDSASSTASNLVFQSIAAGSGISITPSGGTVTIDATGGGGGGYTVNYIVQTVPGSYTYTPSSGMAYVVVECLGGGGAGGGSTTTSGQTAGTGGGAGGYAWALFDPTAIGSSQPYTVGAGGTGVVGADGNDGTPSQFGTGGSLAEGGNGIGGQALINNNGGPGGGGSAVALQFLTSIGGRGKSGWVGGDSSIFGGFGGSGAFGGEAGMAISVGGTGNHAGNQGYGLGSGGGGSVSSSASEAGGPGVSGFVRITEYIS